MFQWMLAAILTISGATVLTSCSNDDDPVVSSEEEYTGVPLIIYDTDLCSSADDLFALEMLYRYEDEGRCRLLGVVVDREGEQNAAFANVMNTYFGHGDIPIGLIRDGIKNPKVWIDYATWPTRRIGWGNRCSGARWPTIRRCPTGGSSTAVCWPRSPTTP